MSDDLLHRLQESFTERYSIEHELDRGGMAMVFLAKDLRHDRTVAIKVLDPALSATVGAERFLREIDVIAQLQHPNILTLIDSGEVDGLPFYVMPYVKGHSLAELLEEKGALPLEQAVQIAEEVADALETAHGQGVIHRDIKPSNVLLSGGHAVVADFGIAAALDHSALGKLTKTGMSMGSPVYMSPEQVTGDKELDSRADIYALGCMLYEMLGGEAPFQGSLEALIGKKVLGEFQPLAELRGDVPQEISNVAARAMSKDREKRFHSAVEFRETLLAAVPKEAPEGWGRRRTLVTAALFVVIAIGAGLAIYRARQQNELRLWAAQTLAEVEGRVDAGEFTEALALAQEVEAVYPNDPTLARLFPEFSYTVPIRTDPPGAEVYLQDLSEPGGEWQFLGESPVEEVRFAGTTFEIESFGSGYVEDRPHRLRFELEGYRTRELLKTAVLGVDWRGILLMDPVVLEPEDPRLEGMVQIPGFVYDSVQYSDYYMDRFEVTNRQFKEFVDAGAYRDPAFWSHPFLRDGTELAFEEAMALFRDQTGRPGPSAWRLGTYPEGQADYPVGGVSWYESEAFARWAGKQLPTTRQLSRGWRYYRENSYVIVPRSNLGSDGPRAVGANEAMTTLGVYDLIGNVREWCHNEMGAETRATRGAAWTDAPFHVGWVIPKHALDRDPTNGFRLVLSFDEEVKLEALRYSISPGTRRDFRTEEPVSDAEFEVFRRLYAYDPYPLDAVVERVDTFEHWVREVVAFDVPYGERGGAILYLPRNGMEPFHSILYWGGSNIYSTRTVDDGWTWGFDYMVRAGRVVVIPLFKGAYGRSMPPPGEGEYGQEYRSSAFRDATIEWVKDLSASIDYIEERADLDKDRVGYFGFSHGGMEAPIVMAIEERVKASVTNVGGFMNAGFFPEADPFNFVSRARSPLLMINGKWDIVFHYETQQLPMFEGLGTPEQDKKHYTAEAGHLVPKDEIINETLAWFDKYLGVPGGG